MHEPRTFTEEEVAKMNKQTEDKILEMLLHIHEKSIGAHPLDPQKDGVQWWMSVVADLSHQGHKSVVWVLMRTLPRSFGSSMGTMRYFPANICFASFSSRSTLHLQGACLGALRGGHSLRVACSARAVQGFTLSPQPHYLCRVQARASPNGISLAHWGVLAVVGGAVS